MGRESDSSNGRGKGRNRKSKGRMSYLSRVRKGGGGGGGGTQEGKVDEYGHKYGDYVPAYGSKPSWRNSGGGGGGGRKYRQKEILRPGMVGFLCSTNNMRENECVREAYNILNEYCEKAEDGDEKKGVTDTSEAEPIRVKEEAESEIGASSNNAAGDLEAKCEDEPAGVSMPSGSETTANDDDDEEEDIDDALASELKNLKSEKTIRKFQRVDTGVKNVLFISTTVGDPTELAYRIFEDVTAKRQTKSRNLLRLLPIELICNVQNIDEVKTKARNIIEKHMKTGYISFKVIVNVRLQNKVTRDELITSLAEVVSQVNPLSYVDLNNSQYTIVAEVLKSNLCLGIVKDFVKFKKYNLLEAGIENKPSDGSSAEKMDIQDSKPENIQEGQTEAALEDVTTEDKGTAK